LSGTVDLFLVCILVALAVGFALGRYGAHRAAYQNHGEALLSRALQTYFGPPDYHLLNHVTLQLKNGTTEIDHILVSRFGVFVIETKDYKGWIFGDARQAKWTQVLFKYKFRFQNPIVQNFGHVRAVQDLLDFLPPDAVKSIVVFIGEAEFKTEIPQGVFEGLSDLIAYLRKQTIPVMSLNRVQFCVGRIETARLAISGKTDVEHVQSLERRYGSPS
jgi:Nuclease-related domain